MIHYMLKMKNNILETIEDFFFSRGAFFTNLFLIFTSTVILGIMIALFSTFTFPHMNKTFKQDFNIDLKKTIDSISIDDDTIIYGSILCINLCTIAVSLSKNR